jgi:phosphate transporter
MKFTHQLKFNAIPEWKEHYINYPLLKKIIYATRAAECQDAYDGIPLDEEYAGGAAGGSFLRSPRTSSSGSAAAGGGVRAPLLQSASLARSGSLAARSGDSEFIKALDQELARIISFYLRKEGELTSAFESLSLQLHTRDGCEAAPAAARAALAAEAGGSAAAAADDGSSSAAPAADKEQAAAAAAAAAASAVPPTRAEQQRRTNYWASNNRAVAVEREKFRQRFVGLFVQLDGLKKYLEMNHTGFRKILKKHDKETTQVGSGARTGRLWGRELSVEDTAALRVYFYHARQTHTHYMQPPTNPPTHPPTTPQTHPPSHPHPPALPPPEPVQRQLHGHRGRQAAAAQRRAAQPAD